MAKKSEMVEQVVETHMPTQRVEEVKVTENKYPGHATRAFRG